MKARFARAAAVAALLAFAMSSTVAAQEPVMEISWSTSAPVSGKVVDGVDGLLGVVYLPRPVSEHGQHFHALVLAGLRKMALEDALVGYRTRDRVVAERTPLERCEPAACIRDERVPLAPPGEYVVAPCGVEVFDESGEGGAEELLGGAAVHGTR